MRSPRAIAALLLCPLLLAGCGVGPDAPRRERKVESLDLAYGEDPRQRLDVLSNPAFSKAPVVVLVHGGAWTEGSRDQLRAAAEILRGQGYVTVLPGYRLSTPRKNAFPIPVQDVACAVAWTSEHAHEYGGDRDSVVLLGVSAGAHIAAMIAYDGETDWWEGCPVRTAFTVRGFIGLSGPYDMELLPRDNPSVAAFLGANNDRGGARKASPVRFVDASDPPAFLLTGDRDRLVPARHSEEMADTLREAGVAVDLRVAEGYGHDAFVAIGEDEELRDAFSDAVKDMAGPPTISLF